MTTSTMRPEVTPDRVALAGDLNQQVLRLTRTTHLLRAHLNAHAPDGVQWSAYVLLFHLAIGGPQRAGALAESVCVDPSTISRQVDQLVRMGLVERQADPDDGRATRLAATDAGVALHARIRGARDRTTATVVSAWTERDLRTLTTLLARLTTDLTDQMPVILRSLTGAEDAQ